MTTIIFKKKKILVLHHYSNVKDCMPNHTCILNKIKGEEDIIVFLSVSAAYRINSRFLLHEARIISERKQSKE